MLNNTDTAPRILVVDDEKPVRDLLKNLLEIHGYECTVARDASEARSMIQERDFELILCDMRMPGESGMDLTKYVMSGFPDTAVIMVSGVDEPEVANTALEIGAYGYILKPFKPNEIIINVANALRRRSLEIQNRNHRDNLEKIVQERTKALQKTLNELRKAMAGTIEAMALTVEMRDLYTAGHQQRVADLAVQIAKEMGLSEDTVEGIRMATMIHDIGKISIPADLLSKPTPLMEIEFGLTKTHPQVAYDTLKQIEFPWPIAEMVYQHHERMDGSGYPRGLSGDQILLGARILGVADVVEAMSSHRPYRPALGVEKALEEISHNNTTLYDPRVVDCCLKVFKERGFRFASHGDWLLSLRKQ